MSLPPDISWLLLAALIAGIVRGFSGFGTAMIYLPVAGQFLSPFEAITTLLVMDLIGPLPNVPRSLRDGDPKDVLRLAVGLAAFVPLGVFVLTLVPPEVFRYSVSLLALGLLAVLITGVRYRGELKRWMIYATGAAGGFLAGSSGLPGPPVILLYMASTKPVEAIRANNMLYLILSDIVMLVVLWSFGELVPGALLTGAAVTVPYLIGNVIGARIFKPGREKVYRRVAYAIIAVSAILGLPIVN